jgi:hypothetical protein
MKGQVEGLREAAKVLKLVSRDDFAKGEEDFIRRLRGNGEDVAIDWRRDELAS